MPGLNSSESGLSVFHPSPEKAVPACGPVLGHSSAHLAHRDLLLFPRLPLLGEICEGLITAIKSWE